MSLLEKLFAGVRKVYKPFRVVAPYVLRNGQTVAYPTEKPIFAERFRGRHKLYLEMCIS